MSTRFTIGKFPVRNDDDAVLVKPFDSNRGQEYLWEAADVTVDPSEWSVQIVPAIIDWIATDIQVDESAWRAVITADMSSDISTDVDVDPNLGLIVYLETETETEVELEGRIVSTLDMSTSIETEIEVDPFLRMSVAMSMVVSGVECGVNENSFAPGHSAASPLSTNPTVAWSGDHLVVTNLGPSGKEVRFFDIDKQKLTATLVQTLHWPTSGVQVEVTADGISLGDNSSYTGRDPAQTLVQLTELVQDGSGQWVASQTWTPQQGVPSSGPITQNFQSFGDYLIAITGPWEVNEDSVWTTSIYKKVAGSWILQASFQTDPSLPLGLSGGYADLDASIYGDSASAQVLIWSSPSGDRLATTMLVRDDVSDTWSIESTRYSPEQIWIEPHANNWIAEDAFIQYRFEPDPYDWITRLWQKDGSVFKQENVWTEFIPVAKIKEGLLFGYEFNSAGPQHYPSLQTLHRTSTGWALRDKKPNPNGDWWVGPSAPSPDGSIMAHVGFTGVLPSIARDIIFLTRVGEYGHLLPYGICLNANLTTTDTIEMLVEILTSIDLDAALNLRASLSTDITTSATINAELDVRTFVDLSTNIQTNITMNPILDIIETEFLEDLQAWAQYGLTGNLKLWKPPSTLRLEDQQAWAQYGLTGRVKLAEPCVCEHPLDAILAQNPKHVWWFGGLEYNGEETMRDYDGNPIVDGDTNIYRIKDLVGGWDYAFREDGLDPLEDEERARFDPVSRSVFLGDGYEVLLEASYLSYNFVGHISVIMSTVSGSFPLLPADLIEGPDWGWTRHPTYGPAWKGNTFTGYRNPPALPLVDGELQRWHGFFMEEWGEAFWVTDTDDTSLTLGLFPQGNYLTIRPPSSALGGLDKIVAIVIWDEPEYPADEETEELTGTRHLELDALMLDLQNYDPDDCHCDEPGPEPEPDPGERELAAHDFSFTKPGLYRTGGTQSRILTQKDFTFAKGGLAPAFDSQTRTLAQRNFSWTKQAMDSSSYPFIRDISSGFVNFKDPGLKVNMSVERYDGGGELYPYAQSGLFIMIFDRQVNFDEAVGGHIIQHGTGWIGPNESTPEAYWYVVSSKYSTGPAYKLTASPANSLDMKGSWVAYSINHNYPSYGDDVLPNVTVLANKIYSGTSVSVPVSNPSGWNVLNIAGVFREDGYSASGPGAGWTQDTNLPFAAVWHGFQRSPWTSTLSVSMYAAGFAVHVRGGPPFIED